MGLHAAIRMRLINMSDDEMWELAFIIAIPQGKSVHQAFYGFKRRGSKYLWLRKVSTLLEGNEI